MEEKSWRGLIGMRRFGRLGCACIQSNRCPGSLVDGRAVRWLAVLGVVEACKLSDCGRQIC